MATASNRAQEIVDELQVAALEHEQRIAPLRTELGDLQSRCAHSQLPVRRLGERYMDRCPDCGHVAYCY